MSFLKRQLDEGATLVGGGTEGMQIIDKRVAAQAKKQKHASRGDGTSELKMPARPKRT